MQGGVLRTERGERYCHPVPTLHLFRHLNGPPGSDLHMSMSLVDEPCKVPYGRFKGFTVVIAKSADTLAGLSVLTVHPCPSHVTSMKLFQIRNLVRQ